MTHDEFANALELFIGDMVHLGIDPRYIALWLRLKAMDLEKNVEVKAATESEQLPATKG